VLLILEFNRENRERFCFRNLNASEKCVFRRLAQEQVKRVPASLHSAQVKMIAIQNSLQCKDFLKKSDAMEGVKQWSPCVTY